MAAKLSTYRSAQDAKRYTPAADFFRDFPSPAGLAGGFGVCRELSCLHGPAKSLVAGLRAPEAIGSVDPAEALAYSTGSVDEYIRIKFDNNVTEKRKMMNGVRKSKR